MADGAENSQSLPIIERRSLCLPGDKPDTALQYGEHGFVQVLAKHFSSAESNAAEKLVQLKRQLKDVDSDAFWKILMEGMTEICQAQYGFVAKRVLIDDPNATAGISPIGESGSCLLCVAFYYNDGHKQKAMHRNYKYTAGGAPCAHMKHDKVLLVPNKMSSFVTHNPNMLPFPAEAYLGVPLFHDNKCFAHFGMMWTEEGLGQRNTSWSYTEMLLHSLEDMIAAHLVGGQDFLKPPPVQAGGMPQIVPRAVAPASHSLKPYARSLSHELRTPMQGVVGMLDVMHATVQEQIEGHFHPSVRRIFQTLRENIETVQDSAKRAVEAADNVVHAYDMNMQIPDTPQHEHESPATASATTGYFDYKPSRLIEGSDIHVTSNKRRRSSPTSWHFGNASKIRHLGTSERADVSPRSAIPSFPQPPTLTPQTTASDGPSPLLFTPFQDHCTPGELATPWTKFSLELDSLPTPGLKQSRIRDLIPMVIHESLRVGGRPDSAIGELTDLGERIVVRSRSSNGCVSRRTIEWAVASEVPETLVVDERDLAKLVSAVFLNAVKFTDDGLISINIRLSKTQRLLVVNVKDTGDGIPEDFQPELFKPFSREDDSLTRSKEGLGLGLLVAKGLARRLGGDLNLVKSAIHGPDKGSEFEFKIPLNSADGLSQASSPAGRTPDAPNSVSRPQTDSSPSRSAPQILAPGVAQRNIAKESDPAGLSAAAKTSQGSMASQEPPRLPSSPRPPSRRDTYDRNLAEKYPLTFLVAEDNKINRRLLVSMLGKLGYKDVHEAFDGKEAVRVMQEIQAQASRFSGLNGRQARKTVDVILMDLWMPEMDGYQATECILDMFRNKTNATTAQELGSNHIAPPIVLAVSADVTEEAVERATKTGMEGFMTKPYKLTDLQRLIVEFCGRSNSEGAVQ